MGTSRKRAEKYWRWLDKHVASVVLVALTKKQAVDLVFVHLKLA